MKHYVYLLKSKKDLLFYIGQTDNVVKRFKAHNKGRVSSTRNRIPFLLVGYEIVNSRKEALLREKELKNHSDKKLQFIRKFIKNFNWNSKNLPR